MALQPVPWATGNGALNPVEGARMTTFAAAPYARGVLAPPDMLVTALPVPGTAVRVRTGGCMSPNDFLKNSSYGTQSYIGREMSYTDFDIPATGSGGGATRYLIWRVDDHQYAGQAPADVKNGPYNRYVLVGSNPYTSPPNYPFVPLAKIVQPANTGTITPAMITDIRQIANPMRKTVLFARPRVTADNSNQNFLTAREKDGGEYFPGGAGYANQVEVDVPEWANRMIIDARWMAVRYSPDLNGWGAFWIEYGTQYKSHGWTNKQDFEYSTQKFMWDTVAAPSSAYRTNWLLMDNCTVPAAMRGKTITVVFKAANNDATGAKSKTASMDAMTGLGLNIMFAQEPDATWEDVV